MAWTVNRDMDYGDWVVEGRRIGAMGRCSQWWIGDWIRYGNTKFGERYARAAKITGYDAQTLMNMVYVASRFDISRRRETLSWSHHETVASLVPQEQDRWLDCAVAKKLSISDLRLELRASRRGDEHHQERSGRQHSQVAQSDGLVCPNCGHFIPITCDSP